MKKTKQLGKKWVALVLAVVLCLALSACGGKKLTLSAEDADLEYAPNVVLEPDKAPYNLGGWMWEDIVAYYFTLEEAGEYTITFTYAKNSEDGDVAELRLENMITYEEIVEELPATGDDWSKYKEYTFTTTMYFDAGENCLEIDCGPAHEGEYVINLRTVTLQLKA